MICRLCLKSVQLEKAIFIFQDTETKWLKIIIKYFDLVLTADDAISTMICNDCSCRLEEFHEFCLYVEQKQATLHNEFLEIKCDAQIKLDVGQYSDNEIMLDMKDVHKENLAEIATLLVDKIEPCDENVQTIHEEIHNALHMPSEDSTAADDDITLLQLRNKCKRRTLKAAAKVKRKIKVPKAKTSQESVASNAKMLIAKKSAQNANEDKIANFMQLACELCKKPATTFKELRLHFSTEHYCPVFVNCCNKLFYTAVKLAEHITWHESPDEFKCDLCSKQLRSKYCLDLHKNTAHAEQKPSVCDICKKTFRNKTSFARHLEWHKNEKAHTCYICGKSFTAKQNIQEHIDSIHNNIYPYICDICGQKFKCKPSFLRHLQVHEGIVEEQVQCEICTKWLKNKRSLRAHFAKHDRNDVTCNLCERVCSSKTALRGHMEYTHKRQKNLQCSFCDKTFKRPTNLEEHIATHTGVQLYSCPHCSKEFRSKANMYVHIKRFHIEEWQQSKIARAAKTHI